MPRVAEANPDGIILVATNPVDVLTYAAWRLRAAAGAGHRLGHDPGHGPLPVPLSATSGWTRAASTPTSSASTATARCRSGRWRTSPACAWPSSARRTGSATTASDGRDLRADRDAAYQIIERKGATYYAVAAGLLRIVEAILRDQRTVLSVSSDPRLHGIDDVYLSLPTVIDRGGVEQVIRLHLADGEFDGLRESARVLRETTASLREGEAATERA